MIYYDMVTWLTDNVGYIREYHPYWSNIGYQDDFDKKIMDLKGYEIEDWKVKKQKQAEKYFYNELQSIINFDYNRDILLCYIPRSKSNATSHIGNIAKKLCENHNHKLIDGTECFYRKHDLPEAHIHGERTPGRHKKSIEIINENLINNAHVLLLDDVITSGDTMGEFIDMLIRAGAKKIVGLGMGLSC
ncbi:phosphoribosyltransferase [Sedimentibacter sp. LTW-03]|uniref:phosphoribosyltransferase n=1 Tax=Sedimentibacter sp. LTW-03 TaxID=3453406 RepID=UPI003F871DCE